MARLNYPDEFAAQQTLFLAIVKQHTSLGAKSPLTAFAKQQKFDLTKLQAAVKPAADQDELSKSLAKSSENSKQQRDLTFGPVWSHTLLEVHFLTGFYRGSERELGEWSVPVDGKARIAYPAPFAEQAALVTAFLAKHNSYPEGESPLQIFIDEYNEAHADAPIDVAADLQAVKDALQFEADKNEQSADSQLATQARNKIWAPVEKVIHLIGGFLMGLYADNSRKMGMWGFKVVEGAAGERTQHSKVNPIESRIQKSIVIPSMFINEGKGDLHVWKGEKKEGDPTIVEPNGQLGITKGFSTITVYNPSSLIMGEYVVIVNK